MKPGLQLHNQVYAETFLPGVSTFIYDGLINFCHVRIPEFMEWIMPGFPSGDYTCSKPMQFRHDNFRIIFLSDDELGRMNSFKTMKKQTEWMCGRFAAKTLALRNITDCSIMFPEIRILNTTKGAPYISDLPGQAVSISHSHNNAVAALITTTGYRLGIDIEKVSNVNSETFMRLAFSENERKILGNADNRKIVSKWSIKEAVLKLIGKGFHHPLKSAEIFDSSVFIDGTRHDSIIYRNINTENMNIDGDFVLSIAYQQICRHMADS